MSPRPFDPAAPVSRFNVDNRVRWKYGDKEKAGTIVAMSNDDAVYIDGDGDGFAPWGVYLGRSVFIRCDLTTCWCHKDDTADGMRKHWTNECQLTADCVTAYVELTLF